MGILSKIANKSMFLNKERSISSLVAIILTVVAFTIISLMYASGLNLITNIVKEEKGNHHLTINFDENTKTKYKNLDTIKNEKELYYLKTNLEFTGKIDVLNFNSEEAELPNVNDFKTVSTYLINEESQGIIYKKLVEGNFPKENNEVIYFGDDKNIKVGSTYKVNDKEYIVSAITRGINFENIISPSGDYKLSGGEFTDTEKMPFDINTLKQEVIIKLASEEEKALAKKMIVFAEFEDITKKIEDQVKEISSDLEIDKKEIDTNNTVLELLGANKDQGNLVKQLSFLRNFLIVVVAIAAVIVIYTGFNVSVVEKKKQYGVLKSTGATNLQILKIVLNEAMGLGVLGIVFGIGFGILSTFVVQEVMNKFLSDMIMMPELKNEFKLEFVLKYSELVYVAIATAITVIISAIIPAILAARVSPIEAIKNTSDFKVKPRKLKTSRLFKKLFGIEIDLARKNMRRMKSKFRISKIALAMSFILILVIASTRLLIVGLITDMKETLYGKYDANTVMAVSGYDYIKSKSMDELEYLKEAKNEISNFNTNNMINEIDELTKNEDFKSSSVAIVASDRIEINSKDFEKTNSEDKNVSDNLPIMLFTLRGELKDKTYNELGIKELKDNELVIENLYKEFSNGGVKKSIPLKTSSIKNNGIKITNKFDKENVKEYKELIVTETVKLSPNFTIGYGVIPVLVNENTFNEIMKTQTSSVTITQGFKNLTPKQKEKLNEIYIEKLEENIKNNTNIKFTSSMDISQLVGIINSIMNILQLMLFGFLALIILIGVTNIFSTISTNIILRSKEFAILKSTGMDDKQLYKMIFTENAIVSLKSILLGTIITIAILYGVYVQGLKEQITVFEVILKLNPIAVAFGIGTVFIITLSSSIYAMRKLAKEDIVVAINKENI